MKITTKKLVTTALLAALVCVMTMSIRIPTPSTGGYIHPGDALVILSGVILGPCYGFLAAGIGSAMADLIGGYFVYIPITFLIKGMIALLAGSVYKKMNKTPIYRYMAVFIGGILDITFVSFGYLLYESVLYGFAGAVSSLPANFIQGLGGLTISLLLYPVLYSVLDMHHYQNKI